MAPAVRDFYEGKECGAYELLGSFYEGSGTRFVLWAPRARSVSVVGDFNGWQPGLSPLYRREDGLWEGRFENAYPGQKYKYAVTGCFGETVLKADPYARQSEKGGTASVIRSGDYFAWSDGDYLVNRPNPHENPMNIYEVHLGSWRSGLSYGQAAEDLLNYVVDMGYTHIELMPLMEYPYDPSWGYQVTGYFSPTARYGEPEELKRLVDRAHALGIGVLMDWVPAHFTRDQYGLSRFDGDALYEHPDPRRSDMRQWGTLLFDYGRPEVRSFLLSSARYWLKEFHMDGLRVDAVSCMLYLDFGKEDEDHLSNDKGGREDFSSISLFHALDKDIHELPGKKLLIAEESTAFPAVTRKHENSLGFDFKWNMGWMNDMLSYMALDPIYRKWNHGKLTFSLTYAFSENYVLPFSHDEVVHGKKSMLNKMPGSYEDKFSQLRLLYMYLMAHPGKKLTFMGMEFGQFIEWRFGESLDWLLLGYPRHTELQSFVRGLNRFYKDNPALYERDGGWEGFTWVSVDDADNSVLAFLRKSQKETLLCVFSFTPVPRPGYLLNAPKAGPYQEVFSTNLLPSPGKKILKTRKSQTGLTGSVLSMDLPSFGGVYLKYLGKEGNP